MDAGFAYWAAALTNMAIVTAFAINGVRQARRGELPSHRRSMSIAVGLVVAFVLSYVLKLAVLGREDLSRWSDPAVGILRAHEVCVLTMVVMGATALRLGLALRHTRAFSRDENAPEPAAELLTRHHRAGRIAVAAALLGFASAAVVLAGMWARLAI